MRTCPRSARVSPARIEISVVLPAPFGPSRPKNSPCRTTRSTPASACTAPKRRATSIASTACAGTSWAAWRYERNAPSVEQVVDAVDGGERAQRRRDATYRQRPFLLRAAALERDHHG